MSASATASLPDDPALLRGRRRWIATITLNRPAAFNSIDLSIAKKLEQLGSRGRSHQRHQGAGDRGRRPGFLPQAATCRPSDLRQPTTASCLWSARCSEHYHAFITSLAADAEDRAGECARLGRRSRACLWPLSPISASRPRTPSFTPAYAKLGVSPDGGGTVGVVGQRRPAARAADLSCRGQFLARGRPMSGVWFEEWFPPPSWRLGTRGLRAPPRAECAGRRSPPPRRWIHRSPTTPIEQQLNAETRRHHRLHAHRGVPRRREEVHEQGEVTSAVVPANAGNG